MLHKIAYQLEYEHRSEPMKQAYITIQDMKSWCDI
jgi:hypothetical protein